ncbi:hypothetical protein ANH9381_1185 [Aggregatibacter actinomycetemcomitans ANH9381]|nr:hypothetical protein ANH9381_1185 [Aggregatibacter actinomycetemcomitans ANH9381]
MALRSLCAVDSRSNCICPPRKNEKVGVFYLSFIVFANTKGVLLILFSFLQIFFFAMIL